MTDSDSDAPRGPEPQAALPTEYEGLTREIEATVAESAAAARATLPDYSRAKARAIAGFTLLIGEAYADGRLDEAGMQREFGELERMVVRFVRMMTAMANTLTEAIVAAILTLLRRVLDAILGPAGLALPPALTG